MRTAHRGWLRPIAALALFAGALATARPAVAQEVEFVPGLELQPATRQALARIQEQWLQWVSAFYQNDAAKADGTVNELLVVAEQLGMRRLPDLCIGALARALASAHEGNFERARWALEQAERFDPGRPETKFAAAAVAVRARQFPTALAQSVAALPRALRHSSFGNMVRIQALAWLGATLLLAAAIALCWLLFAHGHRLWTDLLHGVRRLVPRWAAVPVALAALLWPLALPSGALWLALYLSVLLWGYASASERALLGCGWLLVAVVPMLTAAAERRLIVDVQPPMRALDDVAAGRLAGSLFTDLQALRSVLPESIAVSHLVADVHRRLGQWEDARVAYLHVLGKEEQNAPALIALGGYYFRKGDFGKAIEYFTRAAAADARSAEARYDLSLAFSERYLFNESRAALGEARRVDDPLVVAWIQEQSPDKVVLVDGGVRRIPEIRTLLRAAANPEPTKRQRLRRWVSVAVALAAAVLAIVLDVVRRRRGSYAQEVLPAASSPSPWLEAAIPGLTSARAGSALGVAAASLVLAMLATLPAITRMTFVVPWRVEPGSLLMWTLFGSLVLLLVAIRAWRLRREL